MKEYELEHAYLGTVCWSGSKQKMKGKTKDAHIIKGHDHRDLESP